MQTTHGVVIAGAGLAAQRCCAALRAGGYDGAIRVVGAERHAPYDRPPLSKAFLAGEHAAPALAPRAAGGGGARAAGGGPRARAPAAPCGCGRGSGRSSSMAASACATTTWSWPRA